MATKISELTAAGALTGTETVPVVQSSTTKRTTAQAIANLAPSGSSGQGLTDFARAVRTSGDVALGTVASPTWANIDTGIDLVLTAAAGDFIEYNISGLLDNGAADTYFDVATVVGGSPVNYLTNGTGTPPVGGANGWFGPSGAVRAVTGALLSGALVSGDISGGTVTLRLRYSKASSNARTFYANSADPLIVWAKNLGPAI